MLEDRLHDGRLFSGPDDVRRCSVAEQQPDGPDDDGLAGPRLASDDVQPRLEARPSILISRSERDTGSSGGLGAG